jgi:hypothetical protein
MKPGLLKGSTLAITAGRIPTEILEELYPTPVALACQIGMPYQ